MKKSKNEIQREERKAQIVNTALNLFSQNGFHAVSVNAIAKACNMSKGLLYNYFESKEALLDYILKDYAREIFKRLELTKNGILTKAEFEFFVRSIYRMVKENPRYYKLIFALSFQDNISHKLAEISTAMIPLNFELLNTFFITKGCEDPESEVLMFSSTLKGLLLQVVMIYDFPEMRPSYEKKYDQLIERMINDYIR